jgi:hypothetical protein
MRAVSEGATRLIVSPNYQLAKWSRALALEDLMFLSVGQDFHNIQWDPKGPTQAPVQSQMNPVRTFPSCSVHPLLTFYPYFEKESRKYMRSLCCLCLFLPICMQSVLYRRKVGDWFFSELVVLLPRVRFEVFTAVAMKFSVFWDVAPCGSC